MFDIILYKDRNYDNEIRISEGLGALHQYLSKNYENYKCNEFDDYEESNIAIIWGIYSKVKTGTRYRKIIFDKQKEKNHKVLVMEVGFLRRDSYYSLGWWSIVNFGKYNNHKMTSKRRTKLHITIHKNRLNKDGYILLCGQVPWDTQIQHIDYVDWIHNIVNEIKKYTKRNIIYRPHPKQMNKPEKAIISILGTTNSVNEKLEDDFKDAFVVVAFNSNSLLDALINGLPIFAFDNGTPVYDIANHDISQIETPQFPSHIAKKQKLNDIAYMQWNKEELASGEAFKHIMKIKNKI